MVAGELIRNGLDVYLPCVDDQAIDMIVRVPVGDMVKHYDVQVKSVSGYNRIVGLRDIENKSDNYILVVHYRHQNKSDECLYLTRQQVLKFHNKAMSWGDLVFNKADREQYISQSLAVLADKLRNGTLLSEA